MNPKLGDLILWGVHCIYNKDNFKKINKKERKKKGREENNQKNEYLSSNFLQIWEQNISRNLSPSTPKLYSFLNSKSKYKWHGDPSLNIANQ